MVQKLLTISASRILGRFVGIPLPPAGSFAGQTVLVTGGTTGMGLASAIHFRNLGADVIITYRNKARGEAARSKIEDASKKGKCNNSTVTIAELDMSTYASCVTFVDELRKLLANRAPDVVVLNAGIANAQFLLSPEGW